MDVNITRQAIIEHARAYRQAMRDSDRAEMFDQAGNLGEAVRVLCEWQRKGGFMPEGGWPYGDKSSHVQAALYAKFICEQYDANDERSTIANGRKLMMMIVNATKI